MTFTNNKRRFNSKIINGLAPCNIKTQSCITIRCYGGDWMDFMICPNPQDEKLTDVYETAYNEGHYSDFLDYNLFKSDFDNPCNWL